MSRAVLGNYIVVPKDKSKAIEVFSQGTTGKAYEFTANNYPIDRLEYYEPDGLVAFVNASYELEVWKLTDESASRIHKQSIIGSSQNATYHKMIFDKNGNLWGWYGYSSSTNMGLKNAMVIKDEEGNITGYSTWRWGKGASGTTTTWGDNNFWDTVDSTGADIVYNPDKEQLYCQISGYITTSNYGNGTFLIVYDISNPEAVTMVKRVTTDDLGIDMKSADNVGVRNISKRANYNVTRNQIAYNKARRSVFIITTSALNHYNISKPTLIEIDIDRFYIKTTVNLNNFFESPNDNYYGVQCSPITGRTIVFSTAGYMSFNPDMSLKTAFTIGAGGSTNKDITVNPITESMVVGMSIGWSHWSGAGSIINTVIDSTPFHPNACFVNNPETVKIPSGIVAPTVIKEPTQDDLTPNFVIKLGRGKAGVPQKIIHIEGEEDYIKDLSVADIDDSDTNLTVFRVTDVAENYQYSTNYSDATETGDFADGVEGGVACDNNQPNVFIRYELQEHQVGNYSYKILVY